MTPDVIGPASTPDVAGPASTPDVIIVTWRSGERVLSCLSRLAEQDRAHRAIVVDNASRDGTVELIRADHPETQIIELERNVGFGAAVNAAVAIGEGEAIVLVNDDVEMEPRCLAELLAPLERDPRCGMVAGLTTIPGTDLVDGFGIELDVTLAAYGRLRREPLGSSPNGPLAMPSGGLAVYRRVAFEQVGGFDERLFAYGEDVDIGLRLRLRGWTAAEAQDARGSHMGGASIGVDSPLQRELAGFARGFLLRRYGVLRTRAALRTLAFEALTVGWGLLRHRTALPLRARVRGWRAAVGETLAIPDGAIAGEIGWREALSRLRHAR